MNHKRVPHEDVEYSLAASSGEQQRASCNHGVASKRGKGSQRTLQNPQTILFRVLPGAREKVYLKEVVHKKGSQFILHKDHVGCFVPRRKAKRGRKEAGRLQQLPGERALASCSRGQNKLAGQSHLCSHPGPGPL